MAANASAAGCVFCDVVAGREAASVVHSGETVLAFLDIRPLATGHLLVVPRAHAPCLVGEESRVPEKQKRSER